MGRYFTHGISGTSFNCASKWEILFLSARCYGRAPTLLGKNPSPPLPRQACRETMGQAETAVVVITAVWD